MPGQSNLQFAEDHELYSEPESERSFLELTRDYTDECVIPETPWLSRIETTVPRRNVNALPKGYRIAKRCVDVIGSLVLATILLPVWLLVPLLIKLTSGPGPIIYKQTRVGLNTRGEVTRRIADNVVPIDQNKRVTNCRRKIAGYGKPFTLYKFRTMSNNAEKNGARLAQVNDNRVTGLGRFMRKTRIDEIPQLVNVLRGEMSLVGPRPERPVFVEQLSRQIPDYLDRLGLQPGLTGIAQIENGYDNDTESFRRKVAYDLRYLQNCSIGNDLKILSRTIYVVITGKGAR
ncbi:hypothetical protein AB833_04280 [Chromatiales bacterium (ex Bugula neritina AB1)]|nr:hypothetical protein AB833_04280 [Chromatiales bacterium (ex Bugula neritina AB1)]